MDDSERPGRRIAAARKSMDMTQQQLATRAGVSKSMVAKVESGHATASNTWIGAVAKALGVAVGYLTGQPYTSGSADQAAVHRLIPDVRRALAAWDLVDVAPDLQPPTLHQLAADVAQLHVWRHATAYLQLGQALPGVLANLTIAARTVDTDEDRARAHTLLAMAYRAANTIAHKLGYTDLSLTALDRMEWAAARSFDPLLVAIVDYVRAGALARIGEHEGALRLLDRAMLSIEDRVGTDETALAVYGCLHMKCIVIHGTTANSERVNAHLAEAMRIAARGVDQIVYEAVFGPLNVGLHALHAQVELGEPGKAMEIAQSLHLSDDTPKERSTYYCLDLARAHQLNNDPDKAVEALYAARAIAPVHFASSALARGTILSLAVEQRKAGSGLRALAHSVGIQD